MAVVRNIKQVFWGKPVLEGAGVHLKRVFGNGEMPEFDPFLLLDDFRSDISDHYLKGFPWHPHRGIETITYVLTGEVEHGDSLGNAGIICGGDVQWMTAGSGIIHQEMPKGNDSGSMYGFQLWANLPSRDKMMKPRYQEVAREEIPKIELAQGTIARVIAGEVAGTKGPVKDIVIDPEYLDITVPEGRLFNHPTRPGYTAFMYIIGGQGYFDAKKDQVIKDGMLVLMNDGDEVVVSTRTESVRFLLISGKPIGEPVAWRGPIVMNTPDELKLAFDEYRRGTFIK